MTGILGYTRISKCVYIETTVSVFNETEQTSCLNAASPTHRMMQLKICDMGGVKIG